MIYILDRIERIRHKWIARSLANASSKKSEITCTLLFPQDTSQATKATKSTKYLSIRQRIAKGKPAESRFSRCNQVRSKSSTTVHVHLENTIFEIERFRQNSNTKIEKYCMYIFFNRCESLVFFFSNYTFLFSIFLA